MRRGPEEWRKVVTRTRLVPPATRVLLLIMHAHMRVDRKVSVPRKRLAADLGVSERRISQMIATAHRAGLLTTVEHGYRTHTAVYQGLFPDPPPLTEDLGKGEASKHPFECRNTSPFSPWKGGSTGFPPLLGLTVSPARAHGRPPHHESPSTGAPSPGLEPGQRRARAYPLTAVALSATDPQNPCRTDTAAATKEHR